MPIALAARIRRVKPSPTVALTGRVARLKAEGHDIIGLGVGEPDFDTPVHIADAGVDAIRSGFTRYTAVEGIAELKDAIMAKFHRDNDLTYTRPQILVSTGAKQTIYNLFMAVIEPGDEAVIPAPYWVSYPDMVLLADGVPVTPYAGPDQGYKITPGATRGRDHAAHAAVHPEQPEQSDRRRVHKVRAGGARRGAAASSARADRDGRHVRAHLLGRGAVLQHRDGRPELYDRTVTVNGVSKSYAMTGWRIGYCGGPAEIVEAMATIQSQSTSNPSSIAQKAAAAAIHGRPVLRGRDERALQGTARFLQCGTQSAARLQGPAGRRDVLCVVRCHRGDRPAGARR